MSGHSKIPINGHGVSPLGTADKILDFEKDRRMSVCIRERNA